MNIKQTVFDMSNFFPLFKENPNMILAVGGQMGECLPPKTVSSYAPLSVEFLLLAGLLYGHANRIKKVIWAINADDLTKYKANEVTDHIAKLEALPRLTSDFDCQIETPFISKTKIEVIKLGIELGLYFGETYSCSAGQSQPCGYCKQCQLRHRAFSSLNIGDPVDLRQVAAA
jgi:7-cyano-7-deazaguanine synthase